MAMKIRVKQIFKRIVWLSGVIWLCQLTACAHHIDPCNPPLPKKLEHSQSYKWSKICRLRRCYHIASQLTKKGVVLSQEGQRIRMIIPSYILFVPKTTHFYQLKHNKLAKQLKELLYCYDAHTIRVAACVSPGQHAIHSRAFARKQAANIVHYFSESTRPAQLIYAVAQCSTGCSSAGNYIEIMFDYDLSLKPPQDG